MAHAARRIHFSHVVYVIIGTVVLVSSFKQQSQAQSLSKFEPANGCYVGAFIEKDKVARGDYKKFETLTQKKHASYFTYVGYGMPFPTEWVRKVKAAGAAPHIAFEPNDGLSVVEDNAYLRNWARAAREANCPIFLRFASEMNGLWTAYHGDPRLYAEKFRLVHDVMQREAPNVAMVWTPFATFNDSIDLYYPGDAYVDWVGVNIYSVYIHDGDPRKLAHQEDPIDYLSFIYRKYADRKPIQVSEFAAAHYHRALGRAVVDFAVAKMRRFYETIRKEFPRVKSINWFCMDTVDEKLADSNYCVLDDQRVLAAYRDVVADTYFLSKVAYQPLMTLNAAPDESTATLVARDADLTRTLSNRGGVLTSVTGFALQGIEDGRTYEDSVQLIAVVPPAAAIRYIIFDVDDGRLVRITNHAPFYCTISPDKLGSGAHTIRVTAKTADGKEYRSERIGFSFTPKKSE